MILVMSVMPGKAVCSTVFISILICSKSRDYSFRVDVTGWSVSFNQNIQILCLHILPPAT